MKTMKLSSLLLFATAMATGSLLAQDTTGTTIPVHVTVQNGQLVAPATVVAGPNDALEITVDNPNYDFPGQPAAGNGNFLSVTEYALFTANNTLGISLVNGFKTLNKFTYNDSPIIFSYNPNFNMNGLFDGLKLDATQTLGGYSHQKSSCTIVITPSKPLAK